MKKKLSLFALLLCSLVLVWQTSCKKIEDIPDENTSITAAFSGGSGCFSNVGIYDGMMSFTSQSHFDAVNNCLSALNEQLITFTNQNPGMINPESQYPIGDLLYSATGPFGGLNPITQSSMPTRTTIDQRQMEESPISYLFEQTFGFASLRSKLAGYTYALQDQGIFDPEKSDPDDFFIPGENHRTLLNPELEIQIGRSIYKYVSSTCVAEITNSDADMLTYLRTEYKLDLDWDDTPMYPDKEVLDHDLRLSGAGGIVIAHPITTRGDLKTLGCSGSLTLTPVVSTPRTWEYLITTSVYSVKIDFGDGDVSLWTMGTKTYAANGTYLIRVTLYDRPSHQCGYFTTFLNVPNCGAGFTHIIDDNEVAFASWATSYSPYVLPAYYAWDFGDGTTSSSVDPVHVYTTNGHKTVCLRVTFDDGCFVDHCGGFDIDANCCKAKETKEFETIGSSNRKMKSKQYIHNAPFNHIAGAKSKCLRKTTLLGWIDESATDINAYPYGDVWGHTTSIDCDASRHHNAVTPTTMSHGMVKLDRDTENKGEPIATNLNTLHSYHYVADNGAVMSKTNHQLQPEDCD